MGVGCLLSCHKANPGMPAGQMPHFEVANVVMYAHIATASILAGKAQHSAVIRGGSTCIGRCVLQACCLEPGPVCHMLALFLQRKLQPMPKSVLRRHVNGLTTGKANSEEAKRNVMPCF